ncbi:MAG: phosphate ABC transporter substrate-binding protein PstS [Chloroflexi bacterium]|nr:phosphate ABC transporter substrate-binding protein PstS [Chloroflexota bacterium]
MRYLSIVSLFLTAAILAACGGGAKPVSRPAQSPAAQSATIQITGAGATFPFPLYSRWFYEYGAKDPSVRFNYQSIGSGGGIRQVTAKTVDFGASDAILNAEQRAAAPDLLMFPTVAGADVIAYNLQDAAGQPVPGGLKLTPGVIAAIFLGEITQWNDSRLAQLNPDVQLPAQNIVVAHRSDGSGTTFLFTSYLSQVSEAWKQKVGVGTSVEWPVGVGGKGNEGVSGVIRQQPGSLGYVELAYAAQNKIAYASVQNSAGAFVAPTLASITAASDAFGNALPADMGQLLVNAPGKESYPISGYTFLLLYKDMADCAKAQKLASFVQWAITEGDQTATELLYAPLGSNVEQKVVQRLKTLTCEGGKPVTGK